MNLVLVSLEVFECWDGTTVTSNAFQADRHHLSGFVMSSREQPYTLVMVFAVAELLILTKD